MADKTDWVQKMRELAQDQVPEPVIAASILQPAGAWGAMGAGRISPLAGMLMRKKGNDAAGGLAKSGVFSSRQALVAVTADRLYAFNAKPSGRKWKVLDSAGSWSRDDVTVTKTPGKLATKVVLDVASTGEHFELEASTVYDRGVSSTLLDALDA